METVYCSDCEIHITREEDEHVSEIDRRIQCWDCFVHEQVEIIFNEDIVRTCKKGEV